MNFTREYFVGYHDRTRQAFAMGGAEFTGKHTGDEWKVRCVFHSPDANPSLRINLFRAVFNCPACGENGDVVNFVARTWGKPDDESAMKALRDRFNLHDRFEERSATAAAEPGTPRPDTDASAPRSAPYEIRDFPIRDEVRDAAGALVATHLRLDLGVGEKIVRWERDGSLGLKGLPLTALPLFGSERIPATATEKFVIVCEGEKATSALVSRGFVAVGSVTGAAATPGAAALEILRGREVILWPDFDEPGRKHMQRIAAALQGVAADVQILRWGEQEKDDAFDFFARASGTTEELYQLLVGADPPPDTDTNETFDDADEAPAESVDDVPAGFQSPGEVLASVPRPKYRFPLIGLDSLNAATRGGVPTGVVIILAGWPDAGKTGLATQIAVDTAMNHEVVVAFFTPDGGREASAIRVGGLLGFDQDKLEDRDPEELAAFEAKLADRRIFIVNHTAEGMVLENIRTRAEAYRPDLPHIYVLDSAQECLAAEKDDEKDERHRVISLIRTSYEMAETNPIPTIVLITSQVAGSAFVPKKRDRTAPIGSPAESKKISFLSHMIVGLEGDPAKGPEYGRAEVLKSKLRGPKPAFGLRVDPATSRLREVPLADFAEEKAQKTDRAREDRVGKIWPRAQALLLKHGPLLVGEIRERLGVDVHELRDALDGAETRGEAAWEKAGKTGKGRSWRTLVPGKGGDE